MAFWTHGTIHTNYGFCIGAGAMACQSQAATCMHSACTAMCRLCAGVLQVAGRSGELDSVGYKYMAGERQQRTALHQGGSDLPAGADHRRGCNDPARACH